MTVDRNMLEDIVDFEDFNFKQVTVEDDEDQKTTEDARGNVALLNDEIGMIAHEKMQ